MPYLSNYQYYTNGTGVMDPTNWGSYQYISLKELVNAFVLNYTGDETLINNAKRHNIVFHAKRAVQELNYDAVKTIKVLELMVDDNLKIILPPDYVNWVRISQNEAGVLFPIQENKSAMSAISYLQDNSGDVLFDVNNEVIPKVSLLDDTRVSGNYGVGQYSKATMPTFKVNKASGIIDFSSDASGMTIVIEYVSDGMNGGDDTLIGVNKLAEDYVYNYIKWALLDNKYGVQEYIVARARKTASAKLRNARIRLSNIHPSRLIALIASGGK